MPTQPQDMSGTGPAAVIDYDGWRQRIREFTFSHYYMEMGRAIQREGNLPAAEDAYRRALEISPDSAYAAYGLVETLKALGKTAEAAALDADMSARNPDYVAEALVEHGDFQLSQQQIQSAVGLFEQALSYAPQLAPRVVEGLLTATRLVARMRGREEELLFTRRALALVPMSGALQGKLADLLIGMSRLPEAETACDRAGRLDGVSMKEQSERLFDFANLLMRNNRMEDAISALEKACALQPMDVRSISHLGYFRLIHGDYRRAEMALTKAVVLTPSVDFPRSNIAILRFITGHPDEGIRRQWKVCSDDPNDAIQLSIFGLLQLADGQLDAALDTLRHAYNLAPQEPWCITNLGLALHRAGNPLEAARLHGNALAKAEDGWAATNLGLALISLGREEDALQAFRRAAQGVLTLLRYQAKLRPWARDLLVERFAAIGIDLRQDSADA